MKTQRVSLHFIKKSLVMCVRFLVKYTQKFVNIVCFSKGFDLIVKVFGKKIFFFRVGEGGRRGQLCKWIVLQGRGSNQIGWLWVGRDVAVRISGFFCRCYKWMSTNTLTWNNFLSFCFREQIKLKKLKVSPKFIVFK